MIDTERIQSLLDTIDAPICDNCLASRAEMRPDAVGETCQRLADHGDADREQGTCRFCGQAKIVKSPIVNRNVPG
ncbi:MAG: hypothetical protein ACR2M3_04250 [Thermomicrobiales bacterium]